MSKKFVSYAQNLEDVMLNRVFSELNHGFYIDIGACDPFSDSVTLAFYLRGWTGINVEPTEGFFQQLKKNRPRDLNLQLAVSDSDQTLEFTTVENAGISSVSADVVSKAQGLGYRTSTKQVNAISLQTLASRHCADKEIHFLKIDVEGHETEVIAGADWRQFRPWVLVVEAVSDESQNRAAIPQWHDLLIKSDYLFAWFDGLNRFYVRRESSDLLRHFDRPVNVFDQFTLNNQHAWVYRPSSLRYMLSNLLPSKAKATMRALATQLLGTKLR